MPQPAPPSAAVLVCGPPPAAAVTTRAVRASADRPHAVYLTLDATSPAEGFNRAAAVRTEGHLLFLEAGLVPAGSGWLSAMLDAVGGGVAAAVGTAEGRVAGVLVAREVFDLLGGFDADRRSPGGYLEDFLARLIGLGYECVAPAAAVFLAPPPLRRAG